MEILGSKEILPSNFFRHISRLAYHGFASFVHSIGFVIFPALLIFKVGYH